MITSQWQKNCDLVLAYVGTCLSIQLLWPPPCCVSSAGGGQKPGGSGLWHLEIHGKINILCVINSQSEFNVKIIHHVIDDKLNNKKISFFRLGEWIDPKVLFHCRNSLDATDSLLQDHRNQPQPLRLGAPVVLRATGPLVLLPPPWKAPPSNDVPPLLTRCGVWRQRQQSTLAFGAKSLIFLFFDSHEKKSELVILRL